jgi:hypothetical protein
MTEVEEWRQNWTQAIIHDNGLIAFLLGQMGIEFPQPVITSKQQIEDYLPLFLSHPDLEPNLEDWLMELSSLQDYGLPVVE